KLVANLKILRPRKALRYALAGYGEVVGYVEHDYELKFSTQTTSKEIKLQFHCAVASDECPTIEVTGPAKITSVAGSFQRLDLGGTLEPKKAASGEVVSARFNAKGRVPMLATFSSDAESAVVKMSFGNFESFGAVAKTVTGAQLNETLFDEIGRFLTREPNKLLSEALPDSYRTQLRTKVQQDLIKRRWESKISEQQQTELAELKRQRSITGRFAALVTGLVKKDRDKDGS